MREIGQNIIVIIISEKGTGTLSMLAMSSGAIAMSCHARFPDMHLDKCESVLTAIKQLLAQEFSIGHVTVQLERAGLPAQSGYVMPEPAKR